MGKSIRLLVLTTIASTMLMLGCFSIPDSKIQSDISQQLTSAGLTSVRVSVLNGIVKLNGNVEEDSQKSLSETIAKGVTGVKSVQNDLQVVPPTPEPEPEIAEEEPPQTWNERGMAFLEEYMKDRIVQCDDSYFLWDKRDGLYETKTQPYFNIGMERTVPASEPSAAERLNGITKGKPETWYATWQVRIDGPWRSYSQSKWNSWRDDGMWKGESIEYTSDEEFVIRTNHHDFLKLSEPECSNGDVNVASMMGKGDESDGSSTKTITVQASKDGWMDSGIVVRKGQMLNISAIGKWSNGDGKLYDAAGSDEFSGNAYTGGTKVAGLVAKIYERNYEWPPGTNWSGTAQGDGRLLFRMNDLYQKYGDNKGSLKVTVILSP